MFQRGSSHVLRIWNVKRATGFIVTTVFIELLITKLVYLLSSTKNFGKNADVCGQREGSKMTENLWTSYLSSLNC